MKLLEIPSWEFKNFTLNMHSHKRRRRNGKMQQISFRKLGIMKFIYKVQGKKQITSDYDVP